MALIPGFLVALAVAVLFVLAPVFRARRGNVDAAVASQQQRNREVVQERLQELETELERGRLDADQHLALKNELLATLLSDDGLHAEGEQAHFAASIPGMALAITAALFVATCLLLYQQLGAWPDMKIANAMETLATIEEPAAREKQLQSIVAQTSERLETKPDNDAYQYLLAQGQMELQRYKEAATNYGYLAKKLEKDARLWANYAQAQYLADERKLSAKTNEALEQALRLDPQQSSALGLLGMHAFENGEYASAAKAWRRLQGALPVGSQQRQIISQALQRAESLGGIKPALTDATTNKDNAASSLVVEVSTALKGIPPTATVFIYARAAQGPKMPLAIQRRAAKELPLRVELNDSMAMMPSMQLSSFDNIEIVARISPSGSATPQSGDWQASSGALARKDIAAPVTLDIRQRLP